MQLFLPFAHILVGDILQAQGNSVDALLHCQQAASLAEAIQQNKALAFSLLSLGDISLAQNETAQAQAHFARALALAQQLELPLLVDRASERLERLAKQEEPRGSRETDADSGTSAKGALKVGFILPKIPPNPSCKLRNERAASSWFK